ncbi:MAG TPA: hypothetical protein VIY29_07945 [Ktedonobacteraceae bacterium]
MTEAAILTDPALRLRVTRRRLRSSALNAREWGDSGGAAFIIQMNLLKFIIGGGHDNAD